MGAFVFINGHYNQPETSGKRKIKKYSLNNNVKLSFRQMVAHGDGPRELDKEPDDWLSKKENSGPRR
jgi:hypothetical protein